MAEYLKVTLDDIYGGPWNVIVGERYGGVVTHIPSKKFTKKILDLAN